VSIHEDAIWTVGIDGTAPTPLFRSAAVDPIGIDLSFVRYSPDGSMLAFVRNLHPGDASQVRIFVADADGTHVHRLTDATGPGLETDFAWSPDSKHIGFNLWVPVDPANVGGDWEPRPIGIAAVDAGGAASPILETGPSQGSQGATFEWSPDGSVLIAMPTKPTMAVMLNKPTIIDVVTGAARPLDVTVNAETSWQRLAP
jgi:Tol biopolymer transport system component